MFGRLICVKPERKPGELKTWSLLRMLKEDLNPEKLMIFSNP